MNLRLNRRKFDQGRLVPAIRLFTIFTPTKSKNGALVADDRHGTQRWRLQHALTARLSASAKWLSSHRVLFNSEIPL